MKNWIIIVFGFWMIGCAEQKEERVPGSSSQTPTLQTEIPSAPVQPVYSSLLGEALINKEGAQVAIDTLGGKWIGLYFSAGWCPPCQQFTPKLVQAYQEMQKAGNPIEVVFVSSDRNSAAMMSYMKSKKMPWLAVPYNPEIQGRLGTLFGVRSIPTLLILDSKGELVTGRGVGDVYQHGAAAFEKWRK